jgi:hypothetical protein
MPLRETELESEFEDEAEFEDEFEGEEEGEEFDLGGVIRGLLGESELEGEEEYEDESEYEDEWELEGEWEGEFEDEGEAMANPLRRVYPDAMMEHLGHAAAEAETEAEAEAEAFIGALVPLAAGLARSAAPRIARSTPHLVRGLSTVGRTLRRNPTTRPLVRALPTIASRTTHSLARQVARGRPITPRRAIRTLAQQTASVLRDPRRRHRVVRRARALDRNYHHATRTGQWWTGGVPAASATAVRALAPQPTAPGAPAAVRYGTPAGYRTPARGWTPVRTGTPVRYGTPSRRVTRRRARGRGPAAPSEGHLQAVNALLGQLRKELLAVSEQVRGDAARAAAQPTTARLQALVTAKQRAHDWVRAIERIWDFYFELFGQRQTMFADWPLACDRIALSCYQATYLGVGEPKPLPAPPPFCYARTGFSPATFRRGIPLRRLGRQLNPFPLVQLPYHRLVNPWTLGAVLHEVSHNLQSDLGLNKAVPVAMGRRLLEEDCPPAVVQVWVRWNREIFADLSALLLGGPAVVGSLLDVVGRSPPAVVAYNPRGPHPTPWFRVYIST